MSVQHTPTRGPHLAHLEFFRGDPAASKMDEKTLARELVRARIDELAEMKKKLEKMNKNLEKILELQLQFLSAIEENEERSYALGAALDDGGTARDAMSFGMLLEMAINRLNG
ncbi:hypothetical protein PR003_g23609 [Phytophthora rubi]|uniref:Uncharacterized protein n=1 Tax=Phytophthora rubi TaxID=129364 RepID=A0A6A4D0I3_9STRA|nr:hypothetical protein PR003_g23609 [Phytophthora rubi]